MNTKAQGRRAAAHPGPVGTARHETTPAGVYAKHLAMLQQTLLKDGCYLLETPNADPDDLALSAKITASTARQGGDATKIADGFSRFVGKDSHA